MKAIIYYRKSTDRDDKQANSLEHQLSNCRRVAENYSLNVIKEIWESRSAKTEGTRLWFNEMVKLCKKGNVDYIIIDEPKRLSRNNLDTSRIIDLLDKQQINWILGTSREYRADNSRDKFLLQLDLSLSKMDNEDRSKDVKAKMESCINNTGRFLAKAPFGYKNITIKKGHKEIVIDKKEAKVVKEIFNLRCENKAYSTIANILKKKYKNRIKLSYQASRIHQVIIKSFYYGVFKWNGKDIIWAHPPIITKALFDKANSVGKGVHEKVQTLQKPKRQHRNYYLKGLLKDESWMMLSAYTQKWISYYINQNRSSHKINISESLLFEKINQFIIELSNWQQINYIDSKFVIQLLKAEKSSNLKELSDIKLQIEWLKRKQERLLDLQLEDKISYEIYLLKNNSLENEIMELEEEKGRLKNTNFHKKTQCMLELSKSLYKAYFTANIDWKSYIVKKLMLELFISTKKSLTIRKTPLLESLNILNFSYGNPKDFDIRTFRDNLSRIDLEDLEEFNRFIKKLS